MPNQTTTAHYAMYVMGKVESEWNWGSVYHADGMISIGMMQEAGSNGADLLKLCQTDDPEGFAVFAAAAPQVVADLNNHDSAWWWGRDLNDSESAAFVEYAKTEGCRKAQTKKFIDQFTNEYAAQAANYGFSWDRPQTLIYACDLIHQWGYSGAGSGLNAVTGNCTLDGFHSTVMNMKYGRYTNRRNTVYNMLKAWDGESEPPDFGVSWDYEAGGNPDTGVDGQASNTFSYAQLINNVLTVYGLNGYSDGVVCYKSAPGIWIPATNPNGSSDTNNDQYNQGSDTGSSAAQQVVDLFISWDSQFTYSQGAGRLDPVNSGVTDCSACIWAAYKQITGLNVGTWTGEQMTLGTLVQEGRGKTVDTSNVQPGDLLLMNQSGGSDATHVELITATDGHIWGAGSSPCPHDNGNCNDYLRASARWWVRRYL